jgi:hypothetical protein
MAPVGAGLVAAHDAERMRSALRSVLTEHSFRADATGLDAFLC